MQVRETPDAVALESRDQQWTYAELDRRADQLARHLLACGARPEKLIGVCLPRSPEMVLAILGILKSGGAYLPLDPSDPAARLEHMLADAQVPLLLTQQSLLAELPRHDARVICLDEDWTCGPAVADLPGDEHNAGRLAYAVYTSGSTGEPKAALLTHGGLCNMVLAQKMAFGVGPQSRVLQFASLSFDASVSEIFVTLASGATLCLADQLRLRPGPELFQTLRDMRISLVTLPPSVLMLLGDVALPALQTLIVAGEACSAELATRWSENRRLINAYGPTETTVCATMYECPQGPQPAPPIGRSLPNCQVLVLDDQGKPALPGQPGELCIGGEGVARGYLRRPALTAEKFVRSPLADQASQRVYRTGDLGRVRPDGNLEFLGRLDDQVKINGVRIEPQEIAAALEGHATVQGAVVLADQDASGATQLVAYAVCDLQQHVSPGDLRKHLKDQLPAAMFPQAIHVVDRLPLKPNGKLDRGLLLKIQAEPSERAKEFAPPCDGLEVRLARLWEELLGRSPIGVNTDFFELGGNSLLAMDLLARLERDMGHHVSMRQLIHRATIAELAETLREETGPEEWTPLVELQPRGGKRPLFFVHPGGGNILCYLALGSHLGSDQPLYGLQAPGVDGVRAPLESIEAMATQYVDAIRQVQDRGPYALGGWSLGGAIAYEMARQLEAQGEHVDVLAIIDAGIHYQFAVIRALCPNAEQGMLGWRSRPIAEQVAGFRQRTVAAQLFPPNATDKQAEATYRVFVTNFKAMTNYRPGPYSGKLTLLTARERIFRARVEPVAEWNRLCNDIDWHEVPGTHFTMIQEPHVGELAETLQTCLAKAYRPQDHKAA